MQLHEAQGTPTDALQKEHGEGFLPAGGQAALPQVQQQNKRWTLACGQTHGWASPATASCHVGSCGSLQAGAKSWRTAVPRGASAANKAESAKRPHGPIARSLAKAAGGRRRAQRSSVTSDCPGGLPTKCGVRRPHPAEAGAEQLERRPQRTRDSDAAEMYPSVQARAW